jgi:4-amino-4-deoxy-L-arabinose transferase-like glycosyltransferase
VFSLGVIIIIFGRLSIWTPAPENERNSAELIAWGLLGVLLIAATIVRLYKLDAGLWYDEIVTHILYANLPLGELVTTYGSENQHFLFSIGAASAIKLFGDTDAALRLPAALFGVASIAALYLLGKTAASRREGLLAAALLAFSYHHVWFSQNARGYTGLLFWSILSSWLLLRALDEERPQLWLWYAVAAALGMYTHLTMLFVIAGQFLIYLINRFKTRRLALPHDWHGVLFGFGMAGFLTVLLYAFVLPQIFGDIAGTVSVVEEWKNPLWTLMEFVRGLQAGFSGSLASIVALLLFSAGVVSYWRTRYEIVLLLVLPAALGAGVTIGLGHHLWPRFFFFTFGFGALILIRGVMATVAWVATRLHRSPEQALWAGTIACVLVIVVSAVSVVFAYGPKQDYDGALAFAEQQMGAGDVLLVTGLAGNVYKNYYGLDYPVVTDSAELEAARATNGRTWIIFTFRPVLQSLQPEVAQAIVDEFFIVDRFPGSVANGAVVVVTDDAALAR